MKWPTIALTVIVGAFVASAWLGRKAAEPPALTEHQRQQIVSKAHIDMMLLWIEYGVNLDTLLPAIEFKPTLPGGDAANVYCVVSAGSNGRIEINEPLAAANYEQFLRSSIPHEAAHLLLCQLGGDWHSHGAEWQTVVRALGAEPVATHNYVVEAL